MEYTNLIIRVATPDDSHYAQTITEEMESSAKARGTGIAKRSPAYLEQKMKEGKAVIAHTDKGVWWVSAILKPGAMISLLQTVDSLFHRLSEKVV